MESHIIWLKHWSPEGQGVPNIAWCLYCPPFRCEESPLVDRGACVNMERKVYIQRVRKILITYIVFSNSHVPAMDYIVLVYN